MRITYFSIFFQAEAIYVAGCNSSGRSGDVAFNKQKVKH